MVQWNNGKVICFLILILASIIGLLLPSNIAIMQVVYATPSQKTSQVFAQVTGIEHELKLRATEEDKRIDKVPGFTLAAEKPQIDEGKDSDLLSR